MKPNPVFKTASITSRIIAASLFLALMPCAAHADVVLPSVVQWLSSAGFYSIMLFPAVITVPLLMAISLIEALIVRPRIKNNLNFGRIFWVLFLINAFTSVIGLFTMPSGTELFPGIPLAFLATTVIEGFCLAVLYPKGQRRINIRLFKISAYMNLASYTFLCALLMALIYLPAALVPNNLPKSELSGKIVIGCRTVELPSCKIKNEVTTEKDASKYKVSNIGSQRWIVEISTNKRIGSIPKDFYRGNWQISDNGRFYTNNLVSAYKVIVGDAVKNTHKIYPNITDAVMDNKSGKIALHSGNEVIIVDPADGYKTFRLRLHGATQYLDAVWSPDGKYLAYLAVLSPFTQMVFDEHPDSLRVVSMDNKSITVVKDDKVISSVNEMKWMSETN